MRGARRRCHTQKYGVDMRRIRSKNIMNVMTSSFPPFNCRRSCDTASTKSKVSNKPTDRKRPAGGRELTLPGASERVMTKGHGFRRDRDSGPRCEVSSIHLDLFRFIMTGGEGTFSIGHKGLHYDPEIPCQTLLLRAVIAWILRNLSPRMPASRPGYACAASSVGRRSTFFSTTKPRNHATQRCFLISRLARCGLPLALLHP